MPGVGHRSLGCRGWLNEKLDFIISSVSGQQDKISVVIAINTGDSWQPLGRVRVEGVGEDNY